MQRRQKVRKYGWATTISRVAAVDYLQARPPQRWSHHQRALPRYISQNPEVFLVLALIGLSIYSSDLYSIFSKSRGSMALPLPHPAPLHASNKEKILLKSA